MTDATTLIGKAFDSADVQTFVQELGGKPKTTKEDDEIIYEFKRAGVQLSAEPRSKRIDTIFFYADTYKGSLPHGVEFSMDLEAVEKLLGKAETEYDSQREHTRSWNFESHRLFVRFDTKWQMVRVSISDWLG